MRRNTSREELVYEYLTIIRSQISENTRVLDNYFNTLRNINNNIFHLLNSFEETSNTMPNMRSMPNMQSMSHNNQSMRNPRQSPINSQRDDNGIFSRSNFNSGFLNIPNTSNNNFNIQPSSFSTPENWTNSFFTNTTNNTNMLPPLNSTNINTNTYTYPPGMNLENTFNNNRLNRRRRRRRGLNTRNIFRDILHTTLYTPTRPQPASITDVSNNTTRSVWRDISGTTDQTICPITQEAFQSDQEILRINGCGHVFSAGSLERYLTNFDHRCPICRHDIRQPRNIDIETGLLSTNDISNSTIENNTSIEETDIENGIIDFSNNFLNNMSSTIDISFNTNFVDQLANNLTQTLTESITRDLSNSNINNEFDLSSNVLNNEINNAVSMMSSALLSGLSDVINDPDISGNSSITAEYSLFIPNNRYNPQ